MTMAQAILIAIIAGLATALMSGLLTPGVAPMVFLSLLAPAPLFIAGFGWHPLVAALGGLFGALIANFMIGPPAALLIVGMFAVPAFALTWISDRLFSNLSGRPDRDGIELGRMAVTLVLYLAIAGVVSAMIIEPDYEALVSRIRKAVEAVAGAMGLGQSLPDAGKKDLSRLLDMMTAIMLPMSAMISLATHVVSGTLALQITDRARRLTFIRPDFRRLRLPGGALILLGLAFIVGIREGYVGLLGEIVALGLAFAFMLQGLAVVHTRSIGAGGRALILAAVWSSIVIFTFPALIFVGIGMADHLLNFRRGRL